MKKKQKHLESNVELNSKLRELFVTGKKGEQTGAIYWRVGSSAAGYQSINVLIHNYAASSWRLNDTPMNHLRQVFTDFTWGLMDFGKVGEAAFHPNQIIHTVKFADFFWAVDGRYCFFAQRNTAEPRIMEEFLALPASPPDQIRLLIKKIEGQWNPLADFLGECIPKAERLGIFR